MKGHGVSASPMGAFSAWVEDSLEGAYEPDMAGAIDTEEEILADLLGVNLDQSAPGDGMARGGEQEAGERAPGGIRSGDRVPDPRKEPSGDGACPGLCSRSGHNSTGRSRRRSWPGSWV
jgi:hypothetical protein